jgi:hypothetical protein
MDPQTVGIRPKTLDVIQDRTTSSSAIEESTFRIWWEKSHRGFATAAFLDIFFGWGFWWSLLLFPVFQVNHFVAMATLFYVTYFTKRDQIHDEALKFLDAWLTLSGYLLAMISIRVVTGIIHFAVFGIQFLWHRPVWIWAIVTIGLGVWVLGKKKDRWVIRLQVKAIEGVTTLLSCYNMLQFKIRMGWPTWRMWILGLRYHQAFHASVVRFLL